MDDFSIIPLKKNNDLLMHQTKEYIQSLDIFYPDIRKWFDERVIPDFSNRSIILVLNSLREIHGIMILKNTDEERKISTLYLSPDARHLGIGSTLISLAIELLGHEKPLISIPHVCNKQYENLFKKFHFCCYASYPDYYKIGITEYSYNGYLI